jgi:hypothetical protein
MSGANCPRRMVWICSDLLPRPIPREPITVCLEWTMEARKRSPIRQSRSGGTWRCGLPASQVTGHRRLPLLHAQPPMATAAHSRSVSFAFLSLFSLQATTVDAPHHGALLLLRQPKGSACTTQRSAQLLDTLALSPRSSVYFISLPRASSVWFLRAVWQGSGFSGSDSDSSKMVASQEKLKPF